MPPMSFAVDSTLLVQPLPWMRAEERLYLNAAGTDDQRPRAVGVYKLEREARMEPGATRPHLELEHFRGYLRLLAGLGVGGRRRAKLDPSDLVQQALLRAHQASMEFRGTTAAELEGFWDAQMRTWTPIVRSSGATVE